MHGFSQSRLEPVKNHYKSNKKEFLMGASVNKSFSYYRKCSCFGQTTKFQNAIVVSHNLTLMENFQNILVTCLYLSMHLVNG